MGRSAKSASMNGLWGISSRHDSVCVLQRKFSSSHNEISSLGPLTLAALLEVKKYRNAASHDVKIEVSNIMMYSALQSHSI